MRCTGSGIRTLVMGGLAWLGLLSCLGTAGWGQRPASRTTPTSRPTLNVPYVPTPPEVVQAMVRLAGIGKQDMVYDLGCGDGRLVIGAAQMAGARGVGIDIDPARVRESEARAREAGVSDRVRFVVGDFFQADLRPATVLMIYLLPRINLSLRARILADMQPGSRVVSHTYDMDDWGADRAEQVPSARGLRPIFCWTVPARITGRWSGSLTGGPGDARPQHVDLVVYQKFQRFDGVLTLGGRESSVLDARIEGVHVRFRVEGMPGIWKGQVRNGALEGSLEGGAERSFRFGRPEVR